MNYNLRIWAGGFDSGINLTPSEYTDLLNASKRIYLATGMEEKLDLLLENYLEYERQLLDLALQSSFFVQTDAHRVFREAQAVNRRIANLLMAARLYIDQMKHALSAYFSPGPPLDVKDSFQSRIREQA